MWEEPESILGAQGGSPSFLCWCPPWAAIPSLPLPPPFVPLLPQLPRCGGDVGRQRGWGQRDQC